MPRLETLEDRIYRLQARRNILLTKGGTLNEGEQRWIEHLENKLAEYGILFSSTLKKVA
jgi:hypothetical protein